MLPLFPLFFPFEASQQVEKLLRKGSLDEIVVMCPQRPADCVQNLGIERRGAVRASGGPSELILAFLAPGRALEACSGVR